MAEGTSESFSSSVTDPGTSDTVSSYQWSVTRNGNPYGPTASTSTYVFAPGDNGAYIVTLTVTDNDGGSSSTFKSINVTNVAPTAAISGPSSVQEDLSATYMLSASDVGADVTAGFSYQVDWGDGTGVQAVPNTIGPANVPHTFNTPGNYVITVTATDKDGGTSAATTFPVTVTLAPPPPPPFSATLIADPLNPGKTELLVSGSAGSDGISLLPGANGSTSD